MNKQRRTALSAIFSSIESAIAELETLRDDEQEAYDNMPESFQDGERGEIAQAAIDAIESAISDLESANNSIEEAQGE